jgi:hypothetical protein
VTTPIAAASDPSITALPAPEPGMLPATPGPDLLDSIQRRVLWLAVRMVDAANRERATDRLYRAWQRTLRQGVRTATTPSIPGALRACFPERAPVVTVHDAASHSLAWLGSALGAPSVPLGVDGFGQSGSVAALYAAHDLDSGSIVNAALAALSLR